nr:MAG TPA: hypothetical protein [Caudoviricetes sp.]
MAKRRPPRLVSFPIRLLGSTATNQKPEATPTGGDNNQPRQVQSRLHHYDQSRKNPSKDRSK